jgi:hypothetical protein
VIRNVSIYLVVLLISPFSRADNLVVRYLPPENPDQKAHYYYVDLLKLALEKTRAEDGGFELQPIKYYMVQSRAIQELNRGRKIDVYWTMTSKKREEKIRPIRIPLLKGLLGFRVFIIRKEDQEKFSQVTSLNDLKKFIAGQGHDWPDTTVLRANGLKVVGITDYQSIFPMLEKKRFDYFPRGVNEPWAEIIEHSEKGFAVETHLLFQYPAPIYFFVNHRNAKLAERIERGLQIAIDDGSFEQLFSGYPGREEVFQRARLNERLVFKFSNPLLSDETPLADARLWLDPFKEQIVTEQSEKQ